MAGIGASRLSRRAFLQLTAIGCLAALVSQHEPGIAADEGAAFSWDGLKAQAQALSKKNYAPPDRAIASALAKLDYDQYRNINFQHDKAFWKGEPFPFELELFHSGYLYKEPVDVHIVSGDKATRLAYDRSLFNFGPAEKQVPIPENSGYSGFRLHAPMHRPDSYEEFAVFQGASYFRSRAKGQFYGLSARGLAINTVQPGGEEFPAFRAFWIEKPEPGSETLTAYALLDSKSVTGAYRFRISRSVDTVMEIESELYPRRELTHAGIAPFSSMFFYSPADPTKWDDFRPRVHDSDGLLMQSGAGDWIWRPLVTARHILYSAFADRSPRGFGLMQRDRNYELYQDITAGYEKRASAWVEPLSDWGEGSVDLVELPTNNEYADNIVAFWRPKDPMQPGKSYNYRYKLSWVWHVPVKRHVARVIRTLSGKGIPPGSRYIVIDFAGGDLYAEANEEYWDYDVSASGGAITAYTVTPNPFIDGKRIAIEFHPEGDETADLSFQISQFGKPLTERWVYRWAP